VPPLAKSAACPLLNGHSHPVRPNTRKGMISELRAATMLVLQMDALCESRFARVDNYIADHSPVDGSLKMI
jgi:hypothetical protein